MGFTWSSSRTPGAPVRTWAGLALRLAKMAKIGSSGDLESPRAAPQWEADSSTTEASSLVMTTCYETYLAMYAMLAVFAEQRGDDPKDALGPAPNP